MRAFTIITANYNSGDKLLQTFDSVAGQDLDVEYIVVDGASTDGSREIAQSLKPNGKMFIRVISEPDKGIYEAMNKGVRLAAGRYLYFLGAGDTLLPGVLEEVQRRLPSHDHGFLYGDVIYKGECYDGFLIEQN